MCFLLLAAVSVQRACFPPNAKPAPKPSTSKAKAQRPEQGASRLLLIGWYWGGGFGVWGLGGNRNRLFVFEL